MDNSKELKRVGRTIKNLRQKRNISQRAMSSLMNTSQTVAYRMEKGMNIEVSTLFTALKSIKCDLLEFQTEYSKLKGGKL